MHVHTTFSLRLVFQVIPLIQGAPPPRSYSETYLHRLSHPLGSDHHNNVRT
jgi:hypothetical protein